MHKPLRLARLIMALTMLLPLSAQAYTILILGDSLTEGYGLSPEQSYPTLVERKLQEAGYPDIRVINGGVSGATSASGPNRIRWYLRSRPDLMLLALGANDGLRGLSVEQMRDNLKQTIEMAQAEGVEVVLAGMMIPPNYGEEYSRRFADTYPELASEYNLPLLPFLLEDVAAIPDLNLPDGIHPNAEGNRIIAEHVLQFLQPLLPPAGH